MHDAEHSTAVGFMEVQAVIEMPEDESCEEMDGGTSADINGNTNVDTNTDTSTDAASTGDETPFAWFLALSGVSGITIAALWKTKGKKTQEVQ